MSGKEGGTPDSVDPLGTVFSFLLVRFLFLFYKKEKKMNKQNISNNILFWSFINKKSNFL